MNTPAKPKRVTSKELEPFRARAPIVQANIEEKNKAVAAKISEACSEANRVLSNALSFALVAGLLMIERKEELPHGEFGPWLEKYCPDVAWNTANRFMNAARSAVAAVLGNSYAKGELADRCNFDGAPLHELLVADAATLTKPARDIQNQFRDFLQGKTQHQLLLDWKEIKEKNKTPTPRKQPTPEEVERANELEAEEIFIQITGDLDLHIIRGDLLMYLSDRSRKLLLEKLVEASGRIREVSKTKKGARE